MNYFRSDFFMNQKSTISAVIITFNEEKYIAQCIDSLKDVADEIIVIDSFSTDQTVNIACNRGCHLIQSEWKGYAETKNSGNALAKSDYILSIDADEALSDELRNSIIALKQKGLNGYFSFNRLNNYCGKWMKYAGWYPDTKLRLFPKGSLKWEGEVHETLSPTVKSEIVKGDLLHYSIESKQDHIEREKKYAQLAKPYANQSAALLAAMAKFVKMYILKAGFLGGKLGFQLSYISAKAKMWRQN
jgi:(heptosyl)LPS beta-1,4-glucosyltransferase